MIYLNNSDQGINSGGQIPYSPDLPNLADCTASNYNTSDAWQITTVEGFTSLSVLVNAGNAFDDKTVYLGNSIDLSEVTHECAGSRDQPFSGILDGRGFEISHMCHALFGYVSSQGIVKNLNIANASISDTSTAASDSRYLGIITRINDGTIDGCSVSGTADLNISASKGSAIIGGIAGTNNGSIFNCSNMADISSTCRNIHDLLTMHVGGIAGDCSGTISSCQNGGAIVANAVANRSDSNAYVGGIVGHSAYATIDMCFNTGPVGRHESSVNITSSTSSGGIVGYSSGVTISNCYNAGDINAYNGYDARAGGISAGPGDVSNCYNVGTVTAKYGGHSTTARAICIGTGSSESTNSYYLSGTAQYKDILGNTEGCMNAEDMQSSEFVSMLGDAFILPPEDFELNCELYLYPLLSWQIKQYTVTFDSNGGSDIEPQTVKEGEKAVKPADPTKDKYIFDKWLLNNNDYDFDTPVVQDITLVAKWYERLVFTSHPPVGRNGGNPIE